MNNAIMTAADAIGYSASALANSTSPWAASMFFVPTAVGTNGSRRYLNSGLSCATLAAAMGAVVIGCKTTIESLSTELRLGCWYVKNQDGTVIATIEQGNQHANTSYGEP